MVEMTKASKFIIERAAFKVSSFLTGVIPGELKGTLRNWRQILKKG
jgi:hypothetical protein